MTFVHTSMTLMKLTAFHSSGYDCITLRCSENRTYMPVTPGKGRFYGNLV